MKLPNTKIEKVAAKKDIRRYLNHIMLRRDDSGDFLVATDGSKLAVVPVDCDDTDTPGYITRESIAAARKQNRKDPVIAANGSLDIPNGPSFPRATAESIGDYPSFDHLPKRADRKIDIALNADLLAEIQSAISERKFIGLCFARTEEGDIDSGEPILVVTDADKEAYGVLMPCRF